MQLSVIHGTICPLVVTGTRKRNEVIIDAKGSVLHTLIVIMRRKCAAMSLYC